MEANRLHVVTINIWLLCTCQNSLPYVDSWISLYLFKTFRLVYTYLNVIKQFQSYTQTAT